jgi:hypothetical protein
MATARTAGWLYLLVALTGAFSMMIVPERLIVRGNAAETAKNIAESETLFRAGIASGLLCQVIFLFLVLELDRLFRDVDPSTSKTMVTLVIASVPVAFLNLLNQMAVLTLTSGAEFLAVFAADQRNALMLLFLELYRHGLTAVELFWGLWLFPFGVLVLKSRYLPRLIGMLLIAACFAYVADSLVSLLLPRFEGALGSVTGIVAGLAEFATMMWLLVKGAKVPEPSLAH